MRLPLVLIACAVALSAQTAPAAAPAKTAPNLTATLVGTWECSVSYQGSNIPVVLHLGKDKDGGLTASLDDVTGGGGALDASATFQDGRLHVDVPSLPTSFDGAINATGDSIDGSWSYNGDAVACSLQKDKASTGTGPRVAAGPGCDCAETRSPRDPLDARPDWGPHGPSPAERAH